MLKSTWRLKAWDRKSPLAKGHIKGSLKIHAAPQPFPRYSKGLVLLALRLSMEVLSGSSSGLCQRFKEKLLGNFLN